jgi:hypothetical protein
MRSGVDRRGSIVHNPAPKHPDVDQDPEEAPMPTHAPLAPQIEQFIHDNPQGVLTSFRRNGMPQLSIVIAAADKRVAMLLRPDHVYGTALAKMREALAK